MSITASWDNDEKSIVYVQFGQSWTWEEFYKAKLYRDELMLSVDHAVDFILDISHSTLPSGDALTYLRQSAKKNPPNMRYVIFVGANSLVRFVAMAVYKTTPSLLRIPEFQFACTHEQARKLLQEKVLHN